MPSFSKLQVTQIIALIWLLTQNEIAQGEDCLCDDWQTRHPEWIWCDDFESEQSLDDRYFEWSDDEGDFAVADGVGTTGSQGLRAVFQQGEVSAGSLKKSFGRTGNAYIGRHAERPAEAFPEIFWSFSFRRQANWTGGGGAKLTRATVMASSNTWSQGMIAHLWSGGPQNNYLLIDPASGISEEGILKSKRYNDFPNLRWLGNQPGKFPLFANNYAGRWFSIEAHIKLNTPGKSDGVFEYWIDNQLQVRNDRLDWHGDWNSNPDHPMINAIFLENYWNAGSPKLQERYFDNFIISTRRIACDPPADQGRRAKSSTTPQ